MTTAREVESILAAEKTPDRRIRSLAALLTAESGLGTDGVLVVGGSAIEIYTGGAYVSGDIDILVTDREQAARVLRSWGFRDEGKMFTKPSLDLYVDLMQRENSGSARLTRILSTRFGPVRLGAIEDLIVKRLRETRFWSQPKALAQAILLAQRFDREIEWAYVEFFAKQDKLEDLLEAVRKSAGRTKRR